MATAGGACGAFAASISIVISGISISIFISSISVGIGIGVGTGTSEGVQRLETHTAVVDGGRPGRGRGWERQRERPQGHGGEQDAVDHRRADTDVFAAVGGLRGAGGRGVGVGVGACIGGYDRATTAAAAAAAAQMTTTRAGQRGAVGWPPKWPRVRRGTRVCYERGLYQVTDYLQQSLRVVRVRCPAVPH